MSDLPKSETVVVTRLLLKFSFPVKFVRTIQGVSFTVPNWFLTRTERGYIRDPQVDCFFYYKHYKCQSINAEKQTNASLIFAPFLYRSQIRIQRNKQNHLVQHHII